MSEPKFYDYPKVAGEAGLSPQQLEQLAAVVRRDYPSDEMLYELHLLRACRAIRDRDITLAQALADDLPKPAHQVG